MNKKVQKFALIGAAGYIAPRHMKAIKDTGNILVATLDNHDSVGIIDSYFPKSKFFTEFERFDRHIDKLRRLNENSSIDYISICSPNYLHDSHIRFALRSDANVICEKPLVLNPWNIDALMAIEKESGKKVNTVLQLRYHPSILALKDAVNAKQNNKKHEVELTYVTSRGEWYLRSWKGSVNKSGGIATNIGVHFFDMLHFIFGEVQENIVHMNSQTKAGGYLEYEKAKVKWFLSIDINDLPNNSRSENKTTFRSISCDGDEIEFSDGFEDLHTICYKAILAGNGYGLSDNRSAIETVTTIRNAKQSKITGDYHPFLK